MSISSQFILLMREVCTQFCLSLKREVHVHTVLFVIKERSVYTVLFVINERSVHTVLFVINERSVYTVLFVINERSGGGGLCPPGPTGNLKQTPRRLSSPLTQNPGSAPDECTETCFSQMRQ